MVISPSERVRPRASRRCSQLNNPRPHTCHARGAHELSRAACEVFLGASEERKASVARDGTFRIVRNGTPWTPSRCHPGGMSHTNHEKEIGNRTRASVKKEMAKPTMARSARITEMNLDTARTPERPSATMAGTVERIVPPSRPNQPEQAQIALDGAERGFRDLRIENALIDEHGDEVKLKKGGHVDVTVIGESRHQPFPDWRSIACSRIW